MSRADTKNSWDVKNVASLSIVGSIVCLLNNDLLWLAFGSFNFFQTVVWVVHNILRSAFQVSSDFPSLVLIQVMKRVNILERNINSGLPEHSLVSRGAARRVDNESFSSSTD